MTVSAPGGSQVGPYNVHIVTILLEGGSESSALTHFRSYVVNLNVFYRKVTQARDTTTTAVTELSRNCVLTFKT